MFTDCFGLVMDIWSPSFSKFTACLEQTFGGEICEEVTVSVVFVRGTIACQNGENIDRLQWVIISSFWCVIELFRIKNFLIVENKGAVSQKKFLSSLLTVKSSWLTNHVFPELGRRFEIRIELLGIYHQVN